MASKNSERERFRPAAVSFMQDRIDRQQRIMNGWPETTGADDEEQVTPEWIGGVKVELAGTQNRVIFYPGNIAKFQQYKCWRALVNGASYRSSIPVPTRGHVRRLLAALEIYSPDLLHAGQEVGPKGGG